MFFILFFTAGIASATELSRYQSDSRASHLQKFLLQGDAVVYEKRSTFFDQKKDLRIGKMKPLKNSVAGKKVETIAKKIRTTDKFLRQKNMTFNQLTGDPLHRPHWRLDEFRLTDNSVLDKDLTSVYENLQKKMWVLDSGLELTSDLKKMREFSEGKAGPYQMVPAGKCRPIDGATICVFDNHGVIYVR
jgi:hypothetical protein